MLNTAYTPTDRDFTGGQHDQACRDMDLDTQPNKTLPANPGDSNRDGRVYANDIPGPNDGNE